MLTIAERLTLFSLHNDLKSCNLAGRGTTQNRRSSHFQFLPQASSLCSSVYVLELMTMVKELLGRRTHDDQIQLHGQEDTIQHWRSRLHHVYEQAFLTARHGKIDFRQQASVQQCAVE